MMLGTLLNNRLKEIRVMTMPIELMKFESF